MLSLAYMEIPSVFQTRNRDINDTLDRMFTDSPLDAATVNNYILELEARCRAIMWRICSFTVGMAVVSYLVYNSCQT